MTNAAPLLKKKKKNSLYRCRFISICFGSFVELITKQLQIQSGFPKENKKLTNTYLQTLFTKSLWAQVPPEEEFKSNGVHIFYMLE